MPVLVGVCVGVARSCICYGFVYVVIVFENVEIREKEKRERIYGFGDVSFSYLTKPPLKKGHKGARTLSHERVPKGVIAACTPIK